MGRPRTKEKVFKFAYPATLRHKETKQVIGSIIEAILAQRPLTAEDMPQLHRMATSYDLYLRAEEDVDKEGITMINKKGETVTHPSVNISLKCWATFMAIAREYGFTPKSKAQMTAHKPAVAERGDDELSKFQRGE